MQSDQVSSSTATNSQNNDMNNYLVKEAVRYKEKGYGLFFATLTTLSFFFLLPIYLKYIWPTYTSLAEQKILTLVTSFFFPIAIYYISNIVMYFIYVSKIPFFERYRVQPNVLWPWEKDQVEWRKTFRKSMINININQFGLSLISSLLAIYVIGVKAKFYVEDFPSTIDIAFQLTFFMVVEDMTFYWVHRAFHHPKLYKRFHKQHHEYFNTISIASHYSHPLEFVLANILPTTLGIAILEDKTHYVTILMWLALRISETVDGHCGYEFSWSPYRLLPFSGSSEHHNFHHSHNEGSFGSFFTYWDVLCGTNNPYNQFKKKKEKEQALNDMRHQFEKQKVKIN